MRLNISGKGLELTDALRQYVEKRLGSLANRSNRETDQVDVVLASEGARNQVSIKAHLASGQHDVSSESDDMYKAIDLAKDKLHRVVEDHHDTSVERKRRT